MATLDIITFSAFALLVVGLGLWIGRKQSGHETAKDYFLAGSTIPWWAVGGSLIASNISAEQFIGMSGSGFAMGLAIASYELMAAATLILVAKFFLPIFISKGIYTMPQFLELRFGTQVRSILAVFWVLLFVFVNISSVLYLGAKAVEAMGIPLVYGIIGLAVYSAATSILGGLKTVVWTEVAQVVILILGGLLTTYLALDAVSGGNGFFAGLSELFHRAPEKFNMILQKGELFIQEKDAAGNVVAKDAWEYLPGLSVILGGMWIANMYYWGMNQYIIQRALAAKDLREAQKGVAFAAFLKIVLPLIVVIPGIAAFVLQAPIGTEYDKAYPWVMSTYVGDGLRGITFAALAAAVGSSVSAMVNSASTIFTLDIYKTILNKEASEERLVKVGKMSAAAALLIGVCVAPLLANLGQAFQFIQKYTGYLSPGVTVIFLFGMFWKRASSRAALAVVMLSIPLSIAIDVFLPGMPFLNSMGLCFLLLSALLIGLSLVENAKADDPKGIVLEKGLFQTDTVFNVAAVAVFGILAAIYGLFY